MGGPDHEATLGVSANVVLVQVRQDNVQEVLEMGSAVGGLDVALQWDRA